MSDGKPVAVIDVLNSLLEAELNSIFRFMEVGSPYLSEARPEVRQTLHAIAAAGQDRAGELHRMVEALGGTPTPGSIQPEEQYLAYLSIKFLLPKLVDAKALMIQRHENALKALRQGPDPAKSLVQRHLEAHQREDEELRRFGDS